MKQNSRIGLTLLILQNVFILLTAITFFYFWGGGGESWDKNILLKGLKL